MKATGRRLRRWLDNDDLGLGDENPDLKRTLSRLQICTIAIWLSLGVALGVALGVTWGQHLSDMNVAEAIGDQPAYDAASAAYVNLSYVIAAVAFIAAGATTMAGFAVEPVLKRRYRRRAASTSTGSD